jgi:hypothetical protein
LDRWDTIVDNFNANHGGDDYTTNKGERGDRQTAYSKQKEQVCKGKYSGSVDKYNQCLSDMQNAFDACYDNIGGKTNVVQQTKRVSDSALQGCEANDPNYRKYVDPVPSDLNNQAECEAAGFQWVVTPPPVNVPRTATASCQYKPGQDPCKDNGGMKTDGTGCNDGTKPANNGSTPAAANNTADSGNCGGARTVLIPSSTLPDCKNAGLPAIGAVLKFVILILSVGVGVVAVGGIVYGAILYSSARDNAGQTGQAITIIRNVVIGILLYIFMITILNWLVPGGVIG